MNIFKIKKDLEEKLTALDILIDKLERERTKKVFKNKKKISELEERISVLDQEISELQTIYNKKLELEDGAKKAAGKALPIIKKHALKGCAGLAVLTAAGYVYLLNKPIYINGDKTTYRSMIGSYENMEIRSDEYTPETYQEYINALDEAASLENNLFMSDDEKREYLNALSAAYNGLEIRPDKNALHNLINDWQQYDVSAYTPDSVKDYNAVIADVKKIYDDQNATRKEVSAAEKSIKEAYSLLVKMADKDRLTELYEKYSAYELDGYTPDSADRFRSEIENTKRFIDDRNISQDKVDEQTEVMLSIEDLLVETADKGQLIELYEQYSDYDFDGYTPASVQRFQGEVQNSKRLIDDKNVSQDKVDEQTETMLSAGDLLVEKADKGPLQSIIDECNALDRSDYKEGYSDLESAVKSVSKILEDDNASQEDVDSAVSKIREARNNLVKYMVNVYRVNIRAGIKNNNSVGNDWSYTRYYNNESVHDGFEVSGEPGSTVTVGMGITENDKSPDTGYGSADIRLEDGYSTSFDVTVREDRGRYAGNTATFGVTVYVTYLRTE